MFDSFPTFCSRFSILLAKHSINQQPLKTHSKIIIYHSRTLFGIVWLVVVVVALVASVAGVLSILILTVFYYILFRFFSNKCETVIINFLELFIKCETEKQLDNTLIIQYVRLHKCSIFCIVYQHWPDAYTIR